MLGLITVYFLRMMEPLDTMNKQTYYNFIHNFLLTQCTTQMFTIIVKQDYSLSKYIPSLTYSNTCMQTHARTQPHTHACIHTHACTHTRMRALARTHTHACVIIQYWNVAIHLWLHTNRFRFSLFSPLAKINTYMCIHK